MAERVADSQGMLDPVVTRALPVMQGFPGIPVSQVGAGFRGLFLSQDKADLRDQPLGEWVRQGLREHALPIADRDSQHVGPCIALFMGIVPDPGIGTADADHGSGLMAMVIRDGAGTRITPL
jgi:hypothetical protein